MCPPGPPTCPPLSLYSPAAFRRLCAVLRPAGGIFAPVSSRTERIQKAQDLRKGHLQARHGVLCPYVYPYIPTPQNGPQKPPEARAWHKSTPAHSARSKPGHFHLFRAMDSTAQRSLSASHQAQRGPLQFDALTENSSLWSGAPSITAFISMGQNLSVPS